MVVTLVGNLFLDSVFCEKNVSVPSHRIPIDITSPRNGFHTQLRVGGIANVAQALKYLGCQDIILVSQIGDDEAGAMTKSLLETDGFDTKHIKKIKDTATSKATIQVKLDGKTKYTHPVLGACCNTQISHKFRSDWTHYCYLDLLPKILPLTKNSSGDFADTPSKKFQYYPYLLSTVFVGVEHNIWPEGSVPEGHEIIVHGPSEIVSHTRFGHISVPVKVLKDIHVLGAGDYLAASVIYGSLSLGLKGKERLVYGREKTKELLLKFNS